MEIELTNTYARITHASDKEASWLFNFLTYKQVVRAEGGGMTSQTVSLMDTYNSRIPSGLYPMARKAAERNGFSVAVKDHRKFDVPVNVDADISWLRDYQLEALEWCVHTKRGIIHAPTGSGKTEVMIATTMMLPTQTLILVHRKELLHQYAARHEKRTGEKCGVWGDGQFRQGRVIVASAQAVYRALMKRDPRALSRLAKIKMLLVDECQISASATVMQIANAMPEASYRLGFSATPLDRSDQRNLVVIGVLGGVIYSIPAATLIEQQQVARPKIRMVASPVSEASAEKLNGYGNYSVVYKQLITRDKHRLTTTVNAALKAEKPTIVFVKLVDHGKTLAKMLKESSARAEFVWGGKNSRDRRMAIKRLRDGDIDILVANVILQEGVDIPELRSVVLADGGKSVIASIQMTGRGSRVKDAHGNIIKTEFDVFDIADKDCGCRRKNVYGDWAYAHTICKWMDQHARKRVATYKREGFQVEE